MHRSGIEYQTTALPRIKTKDSTGYFPEMVGESQHAAHDFYYENYP